MKATINIEDLKSEINVELDGTHIVKTMYTKDLHKIFKANETVETPFLTNGVLKYVKKNNSEFMILAEEPRPVTLKYTSESLILHYEDSIDVDDMDILFRDDEDLEEISDGEDTYEDYVVSFNTVMPRTAWFVRLINDNDELQLDAYSSQVFALKDEIITPQSRLYHFPFPNIYDRHAVCWGDSENEPVIHNHHQLKTLSTTFFNMLSNMDIPNYKIKNVDAFEELETNHRDEVAFLHGYLNKQVNLPFEERLAILNSHLYRVNDDTLEEAFDRFVSEF